MAGAALVSATYVRLTPSASTHECCANRTPVAERLTGKASALDASLSGPQPTPFGLYSSQLTPDSSRRPDRAPTRFSRRPCPQCYKPNQKACDCFRHDKERILDAIHSAR